MGITGGVEDKTGPINLISACLLSRMISRYGEPDGKSPVASIVVVVCLCSTDLIWGDFQCGRWEMGAGLKNVGTQGRPAAQTFTKFDSQK